MIVQKDVQLFPGEEREIDLTPLTETALAIDVIQCVPANAVEGRVVLKQLQWGDRKRDVAVIFPDESVFVLFKNTAEFAVKFTLTMSLHRVRVTKKEQG